MVSQLVQIVLQESQNAALQTSHQLSMRHFLLFFIFLFKHLTFTTVTIRKSRTSRKTRTTRKNWKRSI